MLSVFMISAFRLRVLLGVTVTTVLALTVASCEKVPLLAPTGSTITLSASASALPLGGTTNLVAQILEAAGTPPHDGTLVNFTTTLGTIQPSQVQTDINGRVSVVFSAGLSSGTATITASSGGATVAAANAVKIAVGAAAVGGITVGANPPTVPSSGGSSTIVATVTDSSGNLLNNVPVTFTVDNGSLSASVVNTDTTGKAQTILTTSKTSIVKASAGIPTTGTTPAAAPTATVTVNVNTTQTIAAGTPSPAAPTVGVTVSVPLTYGTATGASPIVRVIVNWGDGSGNQTTSGQPGAVSHVYSSAGSYLVQITGVDSFGDQANTSASMCTYMPLLV